MSRENVAELIEQNFPDVPWTGRSLIHRSLYRQIDLDVGGPRAHRKIITAVAHAGLGNWTWDFLHETFPGMEWMMDEEEFVQLVLVDWYRHLRGEGDSSSPNKLKNPNTGNVFHRLALKDPIVAGIRFWAPNREDHTTLGWRFRLELQEETPAKIRTKTRAKAAETSALYASLMEELMIGEPTEDERHKARVLVSLENDE